MTKCREVERSTKKHREVMCYNTEQSWEISERNDVRFEK